ncbi:hypothetical protein QBC44DRAFT_333407 [Cladorrhinum sp. PSN332]|nr:hypothetical protein QBC44DRAFT_333407 [Cladorrhinum sp. PSN332]
MPSQLISTMEVSKSLYVQKYLWRDRSQSLFNAWQCTLTDNEAIAFLAFIAAMLAYAQTRMWTLIRRGVKRATRPIQLADHDDPSSLTKLTQIDALTALGSAPFRLGARRKRSGSMITISPWFGVGAIFNLITFVVANIVVPWVLTNGLESPIVQTIQFTNHTEYRGYHLESQLRLEWAQLGHTAARLYEKCWLNATDGTDLCGRENGIVLGRPTVHVSRDVPCPFNSRSACGPNTRPLQLEYINMTLTDIGLNTKTEQLLSRRLTCAPLNLEHFLRHDDTTGTTWLHFAATDTTEPGFGGRPKLRQRLESRDGKKSLPSPESRWHRPIVPDLRYWTESYHDLHPDLARDDGESTLVVFDAGGATYNRPIDDPLFSAHNKLVGLGGHDFMPLWLPDYEFTAMACLDQQRVCMADKGCTPYASREALNEACYLRDTKCPEGHMCTYSSSLVPRLVDILRAQFGGCDLLSITGLGSMSIFLQSRGLAAMSSFYQTSWGNDITVYIDPFEQWTRDVTAWFESSLLLLRQQILRQGIVGASYGGFDGAPHGKEGQPLPPALFRDGDFTNINFPGFLLTLGYVAFIAGLSHARRIKLGLEWLQSQKVLLQGRVSRLFTRSSAIRGFPDISPPPRINSGDSGVVPRQEPHADDVELGASPQACVSWQ